MTQLLRCDRCGATFSGHFYSMGIENFLVGKVEEYTYVEEPEFVNRDLCNSCQHELNSLVTEWWPQKNAS